MYACDNDCNNNTEQAGATYVHNTHVNAPTHMDKHIVQCFLKERLAQKVQDLGSLDNSY